uniref:Uncharacterized protein LOC104228902 n=1 Tax=Nicotiana sylvestris TaxID=4096 RepID=A0A1U7WYK6_NICSY|nr:PREDICTED: uncharacterized protein LOC104228902 [Nicotiana sylvestris]
MEQKRMDESVLKLAEEQKKEKENLREKIPELQIKPDSKQALELEIECLRWATQVMRHLGDGQDVNKKLDEIQESIKEKEEELEDLEALNQSEIDDKDERLNRLKHEYGEASYELVTTALLEMNESSSCRGRTTELWNYKLERKANLKEGISYVVHKLKTSKSKKC